MNRVYACRDTHLGTLYKTHAATGRDSKIPGLPPHCLVDNGNQSGLNDVDRSWYVRQARETINGFLGIKRRRKNTRKLQALTEACWKILEGMEGGTWASDSEAAGPGTGRT